MKLYTIKNEYQTIVFLNYGATIYQWFAFEDQTNIVITNKNLIDYLDPANGFFGSTIGRYANRINQGKFILNDKSYTLRPNFHGNNHAHGGNDGFWRKKFDVVTHDETKIVFRYVSKDLEENYPGNLSLDVTYQLIKNKLHLTYEAISDQDTIINITNHTYFNLSNEESILNHRLYVSSNRVLETNQDLIPTGKMISLTEKSYDLRNNPLIKDTINDPDLFKTQGIDLTYMFEENRNVILSYNNRRLSISTSYPSVQIFTGNIIFPQKFLNRTKVKHYGVAIEPQFEPDAINHPHFSDVVLKKDQKYFHTIEYEINEEKKGNE